MTTPNGNNNRDTNKVKIDQECDNMTNIKYTKECTYKDIGTVLIPDNEPCSMWEDYELSVMEAITSRLSKDTIFIDIGANWGHYSLSLAVSNNAKKVFAIEPNPFVYDMLYENASRLENGNNKIITYNIAMGDNVSNMKFYYRPGVWEVATLFPPRADDNNFFFETDTPVETLSSFQRKYIDKIFEEYDKHYDILIKMDCEGSEFYILRDTEFFNDNVKKSRKCVVVLELHRSVIETERNFGFPEFAQFLDRNYNIYGLNGNKYDVYNMGGRDFVVLEPK